MKFTNCDKLSIIEDTRISKPVIFECLKNNPHQIIYISDKNRKITGIITLGNYCRNSNDLSKWISKEFIKIVCDSSDLSDVEKQAIEIFASNNKVNQIPVFNCKGSFIGEFSRTIKMSCNIKENISIVKMYLGEIKTSFKIFVDNNFSEEDINEELKKNNLVIICDRIYAKLYKTSNENIIYIDEILFKAKNFFKMADILCELNLKGVPCFFFIRSGTKVGGEYSKEAIERMEKGLSFPVMYKEIKHYKKEFKILLGDKYSEEYIHKLADIPPIIEADGLYKHIDWKKQFVNVSDGVRHTSNQYKENVKKIYVYGRCGVFGYAVEDEQTIPSYLQNLFNYENKKYNVVNRGLWGGGLNEILYNIQSQVKQINENDIVLFYMYDFDIKELKYYEKLGLYVYDCTDVLYNCKKVRNMFYDFPGHMTAEGYEVVAKYIFDTLIENDFRLKKGCVPDTLRKVSSMLLERKEKSQWLLKLEEYINKLKQNYIQRDSNGITGAVVMNCNPFTNGHRYLIERALECVDFLYIFVLEEDQSFFRFSDRLELVKQGTKDLKNVCVLPSGEFVISAMTFPEYFIKDQLQNVKIDTTRDIKLFAEYIAPTLGIKKRFVGQEPFDLVTRQYNDNMKRILPKYGIELCEISRMTKSDLVISASTVRKLLSEKKYLELSEYVPDTTYQFLVKNY